jgi:hypothetical protein
MRGKPKSTRAVAAAVASAGVLVAMALAIPALAQHGGDDDRDPAGTIASFNEDSRILTVALGDGGSVSGKVTRWTWIECDDEQWDSRRHRSAKLLHGSDHDDHDWDKRDCPSDVLVDGAVVEDAVLGLTDGRAFFVKVDLDD